VNNTFETAALNANGFNIVVLREEYP